MHGFHKRIQCGELIFWTAEVSQAVNANTLEELKNTIVNDYLYAKIKGNRKIQEVCFDKIVNIVEKQSTAIPQASDNGEFTS